MGCYISAATGGYYEGDLQPGDLEVPQRPGVNYQWSGSAWEVLPAPAPNFVTMRQARIALLQTGLLSQVNEAIANMPGLVGDAARIEWEFSSTVERNRPMLAALISSLNLTDAQVDDLFRLAAAQ